jgi:hypothetical protein
MGNMVDAVYGMFLLLPLSPAILLLLLLCSGTVYVGRCVVGLIRHQMRIRRRHVTLAALVLRQWATW